MVFSTKQTIKRTSFLADENKDNSLSSFSNTPSTFFSFCDQRREQKRTEIIIDTSELYPSSSPTDSISLLQRRRDCSECELVGLQLLAEEKYYENNDNWDELSLDCEEDESYSSNNSTTTISLPTSRSLPPIQSPTSVMTKKLHPSSKDKLFF
mmetsp:Transcript_29905/g.34094  ORF Transcript_29905/g.34094 Transcript_29905/m.34094 type:complete len:153 (-) Transcript_29905:231-689(-)